MAPAGYRVEEVVGRGAVGTVYRATQLKLGREVALKVLAAEGEDEQVRQRFLRESKLAASLDHHNIVPIYDAGAVGDLHYIAMRYFPEGDLHALIRRQRKLSVEQTVSVLLQIAEALEAAHSVRLVHCDVKPSNVLISSDHPAAWIHAWLTDFGLSRRLTDSTVSASEQGVGTVHYMAPEQIRGRRLDPRTDVYALGCLVYECLTGEVPFPRDSEVAVLYAHLEAAVPSVRDMDPALPDEIDELLASALAKSPGDRPAGPGEFAHQVAALSDRSDRASVPPKSRLTGATPLHRHGSSHIVGRFQESQRLSAALADALDCRGTTVLLSGEPGIGKTTLASRIRDEAAHIGMTVVAAVGLSAEAAPAYWHWSQIVRSLALRPDAPELFAHVGSSAGWLRTVVPDIPLDLPRVQITRADEGRFHVYDSLLRLLDAASRDSGLLVVLEDLHQADEASLLALSFVAHALADKRILMVGTHREIELEAIRPSLPSWGELVQPAVAIQVDGLRAGETQRLIETREGAGLSRGAIDRIHETTGGNPLFISELVTLLASEGRLDDDSIASGVLPLPLEVRDAISARVGLLHPRSQEILRAASVFGERFRLGALAAATGLPPGDVAERLDESINLRLIRALPDAGDAYAFRHGLVQATLYDSLARSRRLHLHQAVGEALMRVYDVSGGEGLAEVAHHFLEAAPIHPPEAAIEYAVRAGEQAVRSYAYDQAVGLYKRALRLCRGDSTQRTGLLQALGEAQMRAGETAAARASLRQAADGALAREDAEALARAVLACGIWGLTAGLDRELVELTEVAVARLEGTANRGLLARVKGFLAAALHWADEHDRRERIAEEALALARSEHERLDSRDSARTLGYVLGRYLLARWGPASAERDLPVSEEAIELSHSIADGELELLIRNWRISVLLEVGRFGTVDEEIARVEEMARELRQPRAMVFLPLHHAIRAIGAGRFDAAERHTAESTEIGQRVRGSVGQLAAAAQLVMIRFQQGRLAELEPALRATLSAHPEMGSFRTALAVMLIQGGRVTEARAELERLTARGLEGFPKDSTHVIMLVLTAEVAAELGDRDRARLLYDWLEPYRGRWAVSPGAAALWPVERSLGRLASTLGWYERALGHISVARSESEAAHAAPCLALAALDEARTLSRRSEPGDAPRILERAQEARVLAQEIDMGLVVDSATLIEAQAEVAYAGSTDSEA